MKLEDSRCYFINTNLSCKENANDAEIGFRFSCTKRFVLFVYERMCVCVLSFFSQQFEVKGLIFCKNSNCVFVCAPFYAPYLFY